MLSAGPHQVELMGCVQTNKNVLFTSRGVYTKSAHSITNSLPFLQPFQGLSWLGIFVSSFAIALRLAGLESSWTGPNVRKNR